MTCQTYLRLVSVLSPVVKAGFSCIIDATFSLRGDDPSPATVDVLHQQLKQFEYPDSHEGFVCISIDTGHSDWQKRVINALDNV